MTKKKEENIRSFDDIMGSKEYTLLNAHELSLILGIYPDHIVKLADACKIPEVRISQLVRRYYLPAVIRAFNEWDPERKNWFSEEETARNKLNRNKLLNKAKLKDESLVNISRKMAKDIIAKVEEIGEERKQGNDISTGVVEYTKPTPLITVLPRNVCTQLRVAGVSSSINF